MSRDLFYSMRVDSLDVRSLIESDHMPITLTMKIYKCEQGVQKPDYAGEEVLKKKSSITSRKYK